MNILVVGAGSIGMLFAGRLSGVPGQRVALIANSDAQCADIHSHGLIVRDKDGDRAYAPECFSSEAVQGNVDHGPFELEWDWILLAVKQTQVNGRLIQLLKTLMTRQTRLLCLQNGLGHLDMLQKTIPKEQLIAAVTTEGARRLGTNQAAHTGAGLTQIGIWKSEGGTEQEERLEAFVDLLRRAGFSASLSKNMSRTIWRKLLISSVINPLTAVLKVKNGQLPQSEHVLESMRMLYLEGLKVAMAEGIDLGEDLWEELSEVCRKTADNRSSMLQDLQAGRVTEADYINGAILSIASKHNIDAPANQLIYHLVKGMESEGG